MTDFATERQDARDRRERDKDEHYLNVRARHCRQGLAEGVAPSLEAVARHLYPTLADAEIARLVERASIPPDRGRTVSTIETSIVKDITRKFLEANREATAREAWQHVLKQGQPTFQESSFPAFVSGIRKELGITMGTGPRPKTEGAPLPSRPRPRRREQPTPPAPSKRERAARLLKKREAVEAPPAANGHTPRAKATAVARRLKPDVPAAPPPSPGRPTPFSDGDEISLQLSGEKLEARRLSGRWQIDVGDSVVEWLLGRVLMGAGR